MGFVLGKRSLEKLNGVHPDLVRVVKRAIEITEVDFAAIEGVRSKLRQADLVASGASKTMDGRHITGHAVDLGAYLGGEIRWDWVLYYKIAEAMKQAAIELGVPIIWGGVWDRVLNSLVDVEEASYDYIERRRALGKKPFVDGPHFELDRAVYP